MSTDELEQDGPRGGGRVAPEAGEEKSDGGKEEQEEAPGQYVIVAPQPMLIYDIEILAMLCYGCCCCC